jgi:oligo-1,6-glucosidase
MHEFIHEMNQQVMKPLDMMSVGEAPASKASDAHLLVDPKREELDMVFTFEHMHIDREKDNVNGRWALKEPDFVSLKKIMNDWQTSLRNCGWNALYFENHDRARVISRWGNDKEYRYESATAFATILHGMQGTPYVYQGEEIGMTNPTFELEEYVDIELKGNYQHFVLDQKTISKEDFLSAVHKVSRDNARTPMQWNNQTNAGFSETTPWFKVNPNFNEINVEKDLKNDKSIFNYYKKLIKLRHEEDILTEGTFNLLLADDPFIFAYKREWENNTWLVVANLSDTKQDVSTILDKNYQFVIQNKNRESVPKILEPFESFIVEEME